MSDRATTRRCERPVTLRMSFLARDRTRGPLRQGAGEPRDGATTTQHLGAVNLFAISRCAFPDPSPRQERQTRDTDAGDERVDSK
jgi:hypothetical protein